MEQQIEITKTGDDRYHAFQDDIATHIDEDVNGLQLQGMVELTIEDMIELDLQPIGHKITVAADSP